MRGTADAYALKLAYHQDSISTRYRPQSADAAKVFEAAEQARVEARSELAVEHVKDVLVELGRDAFGIVVRGVQHGVVLD